MGIIIRRRFDEAERGRSKKISSGKSQKELEVELNGEKLFGYGRSFNAPLSPLTYPRDLLLVIFPFPVSHKCI